MLSLYEKIELLCNQNLINITEMCKSSGVSRGSLTDLKRGRIKTLSSDSISKIAEHFNISTDYLLGNEQKERPTATNDDELDLEVRMIAREVLSLDDNNRNLLKGIIETMKKAGRDAKDE